MSMDPKKWVPYEQLTADARKRIEELYPYLKTEQCLFQEKDSGVFMRHSNGVKVEKLLDEPNLPPGRSQQQAASSGGSSSRSRKQN